MASDVDALPCHAVPASVRIGDDWATVEVAAVVFAHSKKLETAVVVLNVEVSAPIVSERLPLGLVIPLHETELDPAAHEGTPLEVSCR
jgi:hypothetical protein